MGGKKEQVTINLTVVSILPFEAFLRDAAFVRLPLLEATEDYRDGFGSITFSWPGNSQEPRNRSYPSFRLYARTIYEVAVVRDGLLNQGIEVYTKADEIEVVQNLDRSFTIIFKLISIVAVVGYFASMASNILANVNRKSRHLGVTSLIGFSTKNIIWFPIVQSITTSTIGTALAVGLYFISQVIINHLFGQYLTKSEYVCRLSSVHLMIAFLLTLSLSIVASGYAAFRVTRIEPSKVIRDV